MLSDLANEAVVFTKVQKKFTLCLTHSSRKTKQSSTCLEARSEQTVRPVKLGRNEQA